MSNKTVPPDTLIFMADSSLHKVKIKRRAICPNCNQNTGVSNLNMFIIHIIKSNI
jgi:hypothetical protein